jgi:hypothetical protein
MSIDLTKTIEFFCLALAGISIYLLPALIASHRDHHNRMSIYSLNLFLGWTLLGWIAAFIWSLTVTNPDLNRTKDPCAVFYRPKHL